MSTPRKKRSTPARGALVPESEVFAAMTAIAQANFLFASALTGADVAKLQSLITALNPDAVPIAAEAMHRLSEAIVPDDHPCLVEAGTVALN